MAKEDKEHEGPGGREVARAEAARDTAVKTGEAPTRDPAGGTFRDPRTVGPDPLRDAVPRGEAGKEAAARETVARDAAARDARTGAAKAERSYLVAKGTSLSTIRGIIDEGGEVSARDFLRKQDDIDELLERNVIVERGALHEP